MPSTVDKATAHIERRMGAAVPLVPAKAARSKKTTDEPLVETVLKGEYTKNQVRDPFSTFSSKAGGHTVIAPPFNLTSLLRMTSENSVLKQCIEAMVTNISGHGYRLEYVGPENENTTDAAVSEAAAIKAFMRHPNEEYSMLELRKRVRWDMEAVGNGYIEMARDRKGRVSALWHVPAHLVRITEHDKEPTKVAVELPRFDGPDRRNIKKHFRRYVQIKGAKKVYFKEYGDPRNIDPRTGKEDAALAYEDTATEILHISHYHAGNVYGLPRWINNVVAIQGAKQAELTNLDFFNENAVPAMMVMVSGGLITQATLDSIEGHFTAIKGRQAMNRVMFIEAYGDAEAKDEKGNIPPPRLEVKTLDDSRPSDGLFLDYDQRQTDKVRGSFRLPPIFTGQSQEYTRATASTSYDVAEGQVFGPDRVTEDDMINDKILGGYGLSFWRVKSNPPKITDPSNIVKAMEAFETVGAMTPNIAIGMANSLFDLDIEDVQYEWGNYPFSVIKDMAAKGMVAGFEAVLSSIPTMPEGGKDTNGDKDAIGDGGAEPDESAEAGTAKIVRRALMDLRGLMLTNSANDTSNINRSVRTRDVQA
jgi:PBSX family phage portal protein